MSSSTKFNAFSSPTKIALLVANCLMVFMAFIFLLIALLGNFKLDEQFESLKVERSPFVAITLFIFLTLGLVIIILRLGINLSSKDEIDSYEINSNDIEKRGDNCYYDYETINIKNKTALGFSEGFGLLAMICCCIVFIFGNKLYFIFDSGGDSDYRGTKRVYALIFLCILLCISFNMISDNLILEYNKNSILIDEKILTDLPEFKSKTQREDDVKFLLTKNYLDPKHDYKKINKDGKNYIKEWKYLNKDDIKNLEDNFKNYVDMLNMCGLDMPISKPI